MKNESLSRAYLASKHLSFRRIYNFLSTETTAVNCFFPPHRNEKKGKNVDLTKGTAFESIFEKFPTTRENPIGIGRWELRKGRHAEEDGGCKGKENWKGRRRKESEG